MGLMDEIEKAKQTTININDVKSWQSEIDSGKFVESIKASDRTRTKLSTGHMRNFESTTAMEESANKLYATAKNKEQEETIKDAENGLDVASLDSIKNFRIKYTPVGNSVLVKKLPRKEKEGQIYTQSMSKDLNDTDEYVVMVPGALVGTLVQGDVVLLKGSYNGEIPVVKRTFRDIKFLEIDYYSVAGVLEYSDIVMSRFKDNA